MIKRAVFLFLLGVLCVSPGIAHTNTQVFKVNGTFFSGNFLVLNFNAEGSASMSFLPAPLPDGSMGYNVNFAWNCSLNSFFCDNVISGDVPRSAISGTGLLQPVQINITLNSFYATGVAPTGKSFSGFTSVVGTFTPYRGPGGYFSTSSGHSTNSIFLPAGTQSHTATGKTESGTAGFVGTVNVAGGPYSISLPEGGANATVTVYKGSEEFVNP